MWHRLWMVVRRDRQDRELRREMQAHLEMLAEAHAEEGADARTAMDAARREFGNELAVREASRDAVAWPSLDRLAVDVRHAVRALVKDRRFAATALLVLALGIGGNATVFTLVNALLLNPFPYPDAGRLVEIRARAKDTSWASTVRVADFGYWRDRATSYDAVGAYGWSQANLTDQSLPAFEGPERIRTGTATSSFLAVLGVSPALGRFFARAEDQPGGAPVVVLSHGAWVRRFGGRRDILGQTLTLDGAVRTIVGVMPANLRLPGSFTCEVWIPAAYDVAANMRPGYDTRYDGDHVVARLRRGVSPERAQSELSLLVARLEQQLPRRTQRWEARLFPLGADLVADQGPRLRLLTLIVATALLLACANLAGLLLARGQSRTREMAVRASLGAGRASLVRLSLIEAALLALGGGALGLGLAAWGIRAVAANAPPFMGLDSALRIDATVLTFTLGLSLLTGVAFGLVPALHGSRAQLTAVIKGTSSAGRTRKGGRLLAGLVVAEVTLALLLLVGGGLMVRSFIGLSGVDTGIRPENLLTFRISLSGSKYDSVPRRVEFFGRLLEGLRAAPGVIDVAATSPLPMSGEYSGGGFTIDGRPAPANWRDMAAQYCLATPRYFRTMGVRVVVGREFEESDGPRGPVVLVNRALAARFFPGESPVGHRLSGLATIVGVVGDIRHNGPGAEPTPQIYYPFALRPPRTLTVVVRAAGSPLDVVPLLRRQVHALDPDLPLDRLKPMGDVISEAMGDARIVTALVAGFAVFALALAAIGLYGVIAYSVGQRQHEIGIRIALGASRRQVASMVLSRGVLLSTAGVVVGMPLALWATRLLASFLFGVGLHDALVFTAVPALLLLVAGLASYLPARRAAGIDPLAALRAE